MNKSKLALVLLAVALSPVAIADKSYEVLFEVDGTHYIFIDVVADIKLLDSIGKEPLYKRITSEVCGSSDCTTKFWLSKKYAQEEIRARDSTAEHMVAEYRQEDGRQIMVSHHAIERRAKELEAATCVKEVFNKYCLGGSVSDLPTHDKQENEGEIDRRYYGTDTAVFSVKGKVAEVKRIYPDMSWLKFNSTEIKLSDLYGSPTDMSYYPSYADDESTRATAIRLGRAQVVKEWERDGWTIRWVWAEDYGRLDYTHDALARSLEAADPGEGF